MAHYENLVEICRDEQGLINGHIRLLTIERESKDGCGQIVNIIEFDESYKPHRAARLLLDYYTLGSDDTWEIKVDCDYGRSRTAHSKLVKAIEFKIAQSKVLAKIEEI
ncbi:hypothetical protein AU106_gp086 [Sinorhizobium phage phiM9]|uniref:Uncharacterized protein n=1 Tax=Sinorhizobium phage phiM9 TaxID=1636182 RepID=A0A0F6R4Z1_9CAUD|nr:hypothetical protein AU106_gp086 [Sinorhizobium phage phiM9]AKE44717.1 hypothetical protein Sm_phiM9_088 [Sinorhizobium phage phiM9]